ncbi:hypothetical protein HL658_02675 [Azospirillum sp. RWY-5-1]|uniref:Uncharacterized protein n=1 Tax=Azospirillum oleiclasticum TaxID=2735135 RepID=A0ABX2T394_9PROT|nr:hypothetical protein [Azospirillum oleiclasticum]NYZ11440.1 hypothetical protein [Azospirillum oleiclasticum]NYZ18601.1 hypothetical protein [Azospirillum oleiclasticum]
MAAAALTLSACSSPDPDQTGFAREEPYDEPIYDEGGLYEPGLYDGGLDDLDMLPGPRGRADREL